jgi:hypothetical protein
VSGVQEPEDVLDAVRQLESQLEHLKVRAKEQATPDARITNELREMRDEAVRERRAVVDDLRMIVDLVAAGAERTSQEISSLRREVRELRELADTTLSGAWFEVRMHTNGRAPAPAIPMPARSVVRDKPSVTPEEARTRRPAYPVDADDDALGAA